MSYENDGYPLGSPPDRIVKAGRKLFFARGFEAVTTDVLAKEAAVSKATLYKYFPNMGAVLRAVTIAEGATFKAGVPTEVRTVEDLRAALTLYGTNLLEFLNRPEVLQFSALMYEEARRHPEVAAQFYEAAYGHTLAFVEALIAQALRKGLVDKTLSARELAEQLVGMWEGIPMVRAHLGVAAKPFPQPRVWSERCVATLLA
ncbi:MAG: TetR/AcrR family transcriptional regulator [Pseudomonadota bacterium]